MAGESRRDQCSKECAENCNCFSHITDFYEEMVKYRRLYEAEKATKMNKDPVSRDSALPAKIEGAE